MPVYTGVIKGIGSGPIRVSTRTTIRREYVDIGDAHLRNLLVSGYLDDHLQMAVAQGGQSSISVWNMFGWGSVLAAIKLPDGQVRRIDETMVILAQCVLLIAIGFLFALASLIVLSFVNSALALLVTLGVLIGYPFVGITSFLAATRAL